MAPVYPTWIRPSRTITFWLLALGIVVLALVVAPFWRPAFAIALLAAPFLYIAGVLSLTAHRLGPRGGDVQGAIHQLVIEAVGNEGRLLDVGCGSGQLLIRLAKSAPGDYVGIDFWGNDWHYSQSRAERNAALEGVQASNSGMECVQAAVCRRRVREGGELHDFHEVRDVEDKTVSIAEALRVLETGGRFAFVDLFDDPGSTAAGVRW
jgi:SAM-dependent methyltransferase